MCVWGGGGGGGGLPLRIFRDDAFRLGESDYEQYAKQIKSPQLD